MGVLNTGAGKNGLEVWNLAVMKIWGEEEARCDAGRLQKYTPLKEMTETGQK